MRARQKISISRRPSLAVHANCVDELVAAVVGVRVERGVRGLSVGEPGSGSNDEIHVGIKAVVEKTKRRLSTGMPTTPASAPTTLGIPCILISNQNYFRPCSTVCGLLLALVVLQSLSDHFAPQQPTGLLHRIPDNDGDVEDDEDDSSVGLVSLIACGMW